MFNDAKQEKDTIKTLLEKLQRTGNVKKDSVGKVGHLRAAVTEANVEVVIKVKK